jgi:hypothetical protein
MPSEGTSKLIRFFFFLMIVGAIIIIIFGQTNLDLQNIMGAIVVLIIIIVFFVVLYFARRRLSGSSSDASHADRYMEKDSYEYPSSVESLEKHSSAPQAENDFDTILRSIEEGFNPGPVKDEEDSENQLIRFLNTRFSNKTLTRGHTSLGEKVDIVIDGTYCIELAFVSSEGRLISLMDQILKIKQDFGEVAVILLDVNIVPAYTIEKYVESYKKAGAKVIVKKCNIKKDGQEK